MGAFPLHTAFSHVISSFTCSDRKLSPLWEGELPKNYHRALIVHGRPRIPLSECHSVTLGPGQAYRRETQDLKPRLGVLNSRATIVVWITSLSR